MGCGDDDDSSENGTATESGKTEEAKPQQFTPVVASTLGELTAPVKGTDGKFHVVYELELTNAKLSPATLQKVEVLDAADESRVLATLEGEDLVGNLAALSTLPAEDADIEPDGSRLLYIDIPFDSAADAPDTLEHRLTLLGAENPGATEPTELSYTITPFDIGTKEPATLDAPLAGDNWVAVNGCCEPGHIHRDAVQSANGKLWDSQRFAIDYMRLDESGRVVTGDVSNPDSYTQYGADVLAVADGTVVSTINDLPDQVPGALPDPGSFESLEDVDGNAVILDLGGGVFGFYAHLQEGSVAVQPGDEVKTGDKLGLLGNSGNTTAPHLHFHLMTSPEAIAADGIPYTIDSFEYAGEIPPKVFDASEDLTDDFSVGKLATPEPRENELPLNLSIVDFPGE